MRALQCALLLLPPLLVTTSLPRAVAFDNNFACCGGCSSSVRSDGAKLQDQSLVFIWDIKVMNGPAPVCTNTFPYEPALLEQPGNRRVRSGRQVGTSYPLDHDYDSLCCDQRGQCLLLELDASGKCKCVKRWGFTGDHCQNSIYDVAASNNSALFPNRTNLTSIAQVLPDVRSHLVKYSYAAGISTTIDLSGKPASAPSDDTFGQVFTNGSYRQFGWTMAIYAILAALVVVFFFFCHVLWTFCCFRCGCRKRNVVKEPKIYSRAQKHVCGILMSLFVLSATSATIFCYQVYQQRLVSPRLTISDIINTQLPQAATQFQSKLVGPFRSIDQRWNPSQYALLNSLLIHAGPAMAPHVIVDNVTKANNALGQPVFALLDALANKTAMYPIVEDPLYNCSKALDEPMAVRMEVAGNTGCFACKTCSELGEFVVDAHDWWRRNTLPVQLDLLESKHQLEQLSAESSNVLQLTAKFSDAVNATTTELVLKYQYVGWKFDKLSQEADSLALTGLYVLLGSTDLTAALTILAYAHGMLTNRRHLARASCFVGELALVMALFMAGVFYSVALMAQDGIIALQLLDSDAAVFTGDSALTTDTNNLLWDRRLVDQYEIADPLAFADTLRVPPHATPDTDNPPRFNMTALYDLPQLFAIADTTRSLDFALTTLFNWDSYYVATQWNRLRNWTFGNVSVPSPYNLTMHQQMMNSSETQLTDPDNDGVRASTSDLLRIRQVFNRTWESLSTTKSNAQNSLIATQWLAVAKLLRQKERLVNYTRSVGDIIDSTRPLLSTTRDKVAAMERAEFDLKATVELLTDTLRHSKIKDCGYDANCAWFREAVNELFALFQDVITAAELVAITCFGITGALLFGVLCTHCFATRLRRNIVKIYTGAKF